METGPLTPKGHRTREQILAAARQEFALVGYGATTMADIAHRAEISLGGLYRYFRNKEDLFAALTDRVEERLMDDIRRATERLAFEPRKALGALQQVMISAWRNDRGLLAARLEATHTVPVILTRRTEFRREVIERIVSRIAAGAPRVQDLEQLERRVDALLAMTEHAASEWTIESDRDADRMAQDLADMWCAALIADETEAESAAG